MTYSQGVLESVPTGKISIPPSLPHPASVIQSIIHPSCIHFTDEYAKSLSILTDFVNMQGVCVFLKTKNKVAGYLSVTLSVRAKVVVYV